ncbi:tripartite tricarboxylate transporter TctB family protein [Desulfopila sp. IMCC35008]|uniref:tripartite tricarboxylate transporter TctB family protein n=1 Tax=Desulfopila sp. IMCC35008 TaxID=2653858 RepID=UPI0013D5EE84|nr:tripartite tricarboxylate transporter TctB family protein [Desulfopila sp. IMCC35008]
MQNFFNRNRITALVFMLIGFVFLYSALTFEPGFQDDSLVMTPMAYPTWLIYGWLLVSLVYFITGKESLTLIDISKSRQALSVVALLIGTYFFLFPVLGLPLSSFLFLMAFFIYEGMRNFKVIVPIALLISFLFWFVFEKLLNISMPRGILDLLG